MARSKYKLAQFGAAYFVAHPATCLMHCCALCRHSCWQRQRHIGQCLNSHHYRRKGSQACRSQRLVNRSCQALVLFHVFHPWPLTGLGWWRKGLQAPSVLLMLQTRWLWCTHRLALQLEQQQQLG